MNGAENTTALPLDSERGQRVAASLFALRAPAAHPPPDGHAVVVVGVPGRSRQRVSKISGTVMYTGIYIIRKGC